MSSISVNIRDLTQCEINNQRDVLERSISSGLVIESSSLTRGIGKTTIISQLANKKNKMLIVASKQMKKELTENLYLIHLNLVLSINQVDEYRDLQLQLGNCKECYVDEISIRDYEYLLRLGIKVLGGVIRVD